LEGLAVLIGAAIAYDTIGASWGLFALLLLLPDLSLLGYLAGARTGATAYNAMHTYLGPAGLAALTYFDVVAPAAWPVCLIWVAHIGMDRALGLGLKFPSAFKDTHLGTVGAVGSPRRPQ
jgi:hypothetical protein